MCQTLGVLRARYYCFFGLCLILIPCTCGMSIMGPADGLYDDHSAWGNEHRSKKKSKESMKINGQQGKFGHLENERE